MKKYALLFILSLCTLPHLHAAPLSACGTHAFEKKFPQLDWSRLTKIDMTSFAGNISMNICVGVERQTMNIKRIVMRDAEGHINIQETIAGLSKFKALINQNQLPGAARAMTRGGPLMTMRVTKDGAAYVADIRLHRKLGRFSSTDIRLIKIQTKVNAGGEAEASFQGLFFNSLVVKIQTVPSLMLRDLVIGDSSRRSSRELATKTLPTATDLGL